MFQAVLRFEKGFPTGVGVNRQEGMHYQDTSGFPTGVGVNRGYRESFDRRVRFPHRRGGESPALTHWKNLLLVSPQAWG